MAASPGSGSANPRKFSEKIALHTQRQAEETRAFEQLMTDLTLSRVRARVARAGAATAAAAGKKVAGPRRRRGRAGGPGAGREESGSGAGALRAASARARLPTPVDRLRSPRRWEGRGGRLCGEMGRGRSWEGGPPGEGGLSGRVTEKPREEITNSLEAGGAASRCFEHPPPASPPGLPGGAGPGLPPAPSGELRASGAGPGLLWGPSGYQAVTPYRVWGFAPLSQWTCCIRLVYEIRPRCIMRTGKVHSVAGDPRRVQGNRVRRGPRDQHPARLGNCRGRQWRMENRQECPRRAAGREGQRERGQALRSLSADLGGPSAGWGRVCGRGGGVGGNSEESRVADWWSLARRAAGASVSGQQCLDICCQNWEGFRRNQS